MSVTMGQVTVGTSAVQLTTTPADSTISGVTLESISTNTGQVYWGLSSSVTTSAGYELQGERLISPNETKDPTTIYLIASTSGQKVCYRVITVAPTS